MKFSFLNKKSAVVLPEDRYFILMSLPNDRVMDGDPLKTVQSKVGGSCENVQRFRFPSLKVGTFDSLISMGDDLGKIDAFVGNTVKKIGRLVYDLAVKEKATEQHLTVHSVEMETYMRQFTWDPATFKPESPLRDIVTAISEQTSAIELELRKKQAQYQQLTNALNAAERRKNANLLSRPIGDLLVEGDYVDTESLTTLFVAMPLSSVKEWNRTYESLLKLHGDDPAAEAQAADKAAEQAEAKRAAELAERATLRDKKLAELRRGGAESAPLIQKLQDKWRDEDAAEAAELAARQPEQAEAPLTPEEERQRRVRAEVRAQRWVVPRSSKKISEDSQYALFRVVMFRAVADDFKKACARSKVYSVREYAAPARDAEDEGGAKKGKEKAQEEEEGDGADQAEEQLRQERALLKWSKINFSETFIAWAHLKVVRLFVETVLRYGLGSGPSKDVAGNYTALLVEPKKGNSAKVAKSLNAAFKYLSSGFIDGKDDAEADGLMGNQEKMFSCVLTTMDVEVTGS